MPTKAKDVDAVDLGFIADRLSLLGPAARLHVLILADGQHTVGQIASEAGISISAVSQHIAKLKAYGLVLPRRVAQEQYYMKDGTALQAALDKAAKALGL